jgi:putative FmdB family regulatory protein
MPAYDYACNKCGLVNEIRHGMTETKKYKCTECGHKYMEKQISATFHVAQSYHAGPTMADRKEGEHTKRVKDLDRAVKARKRQFGFDAVGTPVDTPDPKHIVKRGRTLGGQQLEVDKTEFVKAAAKDPAMVKKAQDALKKSRSKK